jgi:D-glycero-alpha-D-manno-heptose-7-phosphate kinase
LIISRTPYRVSFFGGGTDYNPWYEENGGLIIACGLAHYCYLTARILPPFFEEHKSRIVYSKVEGVKDNSDISHPSVRGCLKYLQISKGVEIHHDGDLPARSGLGSSSSFTVGMLNALHALENRIVSPNDLAKQAIEVEQQVLKESVGIQDQIMASFGGMKIIEMGPGRQWFAKPLILPEDYRKEFESHVLLGFSGISRIANDHAKEQIESIKSGKSSDHLKCILELANEALKAFTENSNIDYLGKILDQSWQAKRSISSGTSLEWMNELYQTAMQNGAFGGKLLGAGGGGFFAFIAPPKSHEKIKNALPKIKVWVPFKIDHSGSQIIFNQH